MKGFVDRCLSGVLAVFLLTSVAACAPQQAAGLPGPVVMDIKMTEYRFQFDPSRLRTGRTLFKAVNEGSLPHQVVLLILPPDTPPILEQLRSSQRKVVSQLASFPPKPPDSNAAFAVDLEPGRYAIVCFVADSDGVQHGAKGMAAEFTIK